MTRLKWLGAAAALATVIATPVMAQEATQEPGMIGYNYPNSHYLTGGWGVHTPPSWTGRWPRVHTGYVAAPAYGYRYAPSVYAPTFGPYAYDPY
jgi:hypothetical protein